MKCIKYSGTARIERVENDEAHAAVKAGKAQYVPKNVWKREVRDA